MKHVLVPLSLYSIQTFHEFQNTHDALQKTEPHETNTHSRENNDEKMQAQYYSDSATVSQALSLTARPTNINAGPSTRPDQTTRIINDQMQAKGPRVGDTTSLGMDRRFRQRGIHGSR